MRPYQSSDTVQAFAVRRRVSCRFASEPRSRTPFGTAPSRSSLFALSVGGPIGPGKPSFRNGDNYAEAGYKDVNSVLSPPAQRRLAGGLLEILD